MRRIKPRVCYHPCDMDSKEAERRALDLIGNYKKSDAADDAERLLAEGLAAIEENGASKRHKRHFYDREDLKLLKAVYEKCHFPTAFMYEFLAQKIGVSARNIQIWFQNKASPCRMNNF